MFLINQATSIHVVRIFYNPNIQNSQKQGHKSPEQKQTPCFLPYFGKCVQKPYFFKKKNQAHPSSIDTEIQANTKYESKAKKASQKTKKISSAPNQGSIKAQSKKHS